jgi:PD-(D/E)XK nuclease superfamily
MAFKLTSVYHIDRPLSWSAISLFEWNPRMWYEKYISGEQPLETPELKFGKMVDERIQKDPKYLPHVIRYKVLQHEMRCDWNGIPLIGYADTYEPIDGSRVIKVRDYKTGRKEWTQKRADETGQLTMYLWMLYLMDKKIDVAKAELYIDWLPTHIKNGEIAFVEPDYKKLKPVTFKTKRSMHDILKFGQRINQTWLEMETYAGSRKPSFAEDLKDF